MKSHQEAVISLRGWFKTTRFAVNQYTQLFLWGGVELFHPGSPVRLNQSPVRSPIDQSVSHSSVLVGT
jgi:hypothetical protein